MQEKRKSMLERGISLIEGVLYLVIALAVIVGGIVFFQQAQMSNQVSNVSRIMSLVSTQLVDIERQGSSVTPTNPVYNSGIIAIRSEMVPGNAVSSRGDRLIAPWGGEIMIYTENRPIAGVPNQPLVRAGLQDVPTEACIRLATMDESGLGPLGDKIFRIELVRWPANVEMTHTRFSFATIVFTRERGNPITPRDIANACRNSNGIIASYFP